MTQNTAAEIERLRRWRLVLGGGDADGIGGEGPSGDLLSQIDLGMDGALEALYGERGRRGGLGGSAPSVARWLGDIRSYFPSSVVRVMQQDALERLNLHAMLLEPELLESFEPDLKLATTLMALKGVMPDHVKDTARVVVRRVVADLEARLSEPMRQAVTGSLNRASRNSRPRHQEIDWGRTIRANLKHYQPQHRTVIPERRLGYGRGRRSLRDVVLCLDQSGSMASSIVYAGVFGAVMASLSAVSTRLVAFDTSVVDLSENLEDPVDVLFGIQLGGGTDINRAVAYCEAHITRPEDTVLVLVSDLIEGGDQGRLLRRVGNLVSSGVQVISLLALSDEGAPMYDHEMAAAFAALGAPAFACTPDLFPELMAAALQKQDVGQWAAAHDLVTTRKSR
ncbi:vWA domain-containing protein [Deinococcus peraridilitoris]|uniref:Uncharacterized protein containing a von Willebrand factor type A (VWA) domain protein n=1 Tax=Deinococcus peraridilitoris (strain DSM 19664 / LMG 22246 / CIP 109416 / KR-200) TaxID=937777 RepID=L0A3Y1_DEIPD|nr:VWA domain-containing protein [Deinococcus peraridilitoris]AFZ67725.1 uncharacterized protein containing a von Willebrand factor type A (vWA) domain protein [Deinococcus peraridilitoris DSM 19664]